MYLPQFVMRRQDDDISHLLNQVHHCDAMALLRRLPDASIDMVLCDLPYGVTACAWDTIIPIEPMWEQLKRVVKERSAIVLTATQPFTSRLVSSNYEMFQDEIVWYKNRPTRFLDAYKRPLLQHEVALVFGVKLPNYYPQITKKHKDDIRPNTGASKKSRHLHGSYSLKVDRKIGLDETLPRSVVHFNNASSEGDYYHPTQKPVALFEYLIRTYTQEGEIVLDMTCGSGTTGLAARKTGRQFICGDNHLPYVELARKRLADTDPYVATELPDGSKQLSLFEGKGA